VIDTREQLSPLSIGLHWLIGLTMIGMVIFGLVLEDMPKGETKSALLALHKSIGVIVLVFASWRLARRIRLGLPEHVGIYKAWELSLAKAVHYFLLFATLALPISGILMTVANTRAISVFGVTVIPQLFAQKNELLAKIGGATHSVMGKLILLAIALHIAGALKHHIMDSDGTLRRMLGARVEPSRHA
jgi:cytochrome b561